MHKASLICDSRFEGFYMHEEENNTSTKIQAHEYLMSIHMPIAIYLLIQCIEHYALHTSIYGLRA